MHQQALAQDASVFDYDGVYDDMQAAKEQPKQQDKIQRQSRCVALAPPSCWPFLSCGALFPC